VNIIKKITTSIFKNNLINKNRLKKKDDKHLLLMCAPVIIHLLIFAYLPMIGIIIAFKDFRYDLGFLGSEWVGFENFRFFFASAKAWIVTRNTVGLNLLFMFCGHLASLTIALAMFELKRRVFTKAYQTIMILPFFLSWVVVSFISYAFLNPAYGILNQLVQYLGRQPIQWYFRSGLWPFILLFINLWKTAGWGSIIYYAALMGINPELFDAAAIDGTSKWQEIRYIKLPLLVPIMIILFILGLGNIIRADFGLFYQIPRNIPALYSSTDVIDTYVFRMLRDIGDFGMSAAVGLYQSFVGFVLVIVTNYIIRKTSPENALF